MHNEHGLKNMFSVFETDLNTLKSFDNIHDAKKYVRERPDLNLIIIPTYEVLSIEEEKEREEKGYVSPAASIEIKERFPISPEAYELINKVKFSGGQGNAYCVVRDKDGNILNDSRNNAL